MRTVFCVHSLSPEHPFKMADEEDYLLLLVLIVTLHRRRRQKKSKRFWVREIFPNHKRCGEFHNLVRELRLGDSSLDGSELARERPNPTWPPTIDRECMTSWPREPLGPGGSRGR